VEGDFLTTCKLIKSKTTISLEFLFLYRTLMFRTGPQEAEILPSCSKLPLLIAKFKIMHIIIL
jgi:hypothetical protein